MKDITDKNFGVIIAFWLPGFLLLWGLSYSSPDIALWLRKSSGAEAPTVGSFLYATLASLAAGLLISAVRWLLVDHFFWVCGFLVRGLRRPALDMSRLTGEGVLAAFSGAVENHYRYYQYYSNTLVAVAVGFIAYAGSEKGVWLSKLGFIVAGIEIALLLAAGDCLRKYHNAASQILSHTEGAVDDERLATRQKGGEEEGGEKGAQEGRAEEGAQEGRAEEKGGEKGSLKEEGLIEAEANQRRAGDAG